MDGSGTTTQAELLRIYLKEKGYKVEQTAEPSGNLIGGLVRGVLTRQWHLNPVGSATSFRGGSGAPSRKLCSAGAREKASRHQHQVFFSSFAFGALDLDRKWLAEINKNFLVPDITFFIDADPAECLRRIAKTRIKKRIF